MKKGAFGIPRANLALPPTLLPRSPPPPHPRAYSVSPTSSSDHFSSRTKDTAGRAGRKTTNRILRPTPLHTQRYAAHNRPHPPPWCAYLYLTHNLHITPYTSHPHTSHPTHHTLKTHHTPTPASCVLRACAAACAILLVLRSSPPPVFFFPSCALLLLLYSSPPPTLFSSFSAFLLHVPPPPPPRTQLRGHRLDRRRVCDRYEHECHLSVVAGPA